MDGDRVVVGRGDAGGSGADGGGVLI
jgi:hypothetical protein